MLTPRENLLRVFRHEVPEWVPLVGHVDGYNQPSREGMEPGLAAALEGQPDWGPTGIIDFCRILGLDIMDRYGPPVIPRNDGVVVHSEWEGEVLHNWWETPLGELHERKRRANVTAPYYTIEHALKTGLDLQILAGLFETEEFELDPAGVEALRERRALVGDDGIVTLSMPATPLGNLVRIYAGVAGLAYLQADHPTELHDLLSVMEDNYLRQMRLAVTVEPEAVISYDDTSTTTISPTMFRELEASYINHAAGICHDAGTLYIHHSCGLLRDLLAWYARTDMDAVDALCAKPIGDVTLAEARRRLGPAITMIASLVQLSESPRDAETMRRSVEEMLAGVAADDNLVLILFADPRWTMDQTRELAECAKGFQPVCGGEDGSL